MLTSERAEPIGWIELDPTLSLSSLHREDIHTCKCIFTYMYRCEMIGFSADKVKWTPCGETLG